MSHLRSQTFYIYFFIVMTNKLKNVQGEQSQNEALLMALQTEFLDQCELEDVKESINSISLFINTTIIQDPINADSLEPSDIYALKVFSDFIKKLITISKTTQKQLILN